LVLDPDVEGRQQVGVPDRAVHDDALPAVARGLRSHVDPQQCGMAGPAAVDDEDTAPSGFGDGMHHQDVVVDADGVRGHIGPT
jgi:hypothetical protein